MAEEIRCLPDNHEAKIKMLEVCLNIILWLFFLILFHAFSMPQIFLFFLQVGKMSLYAASSAIKEIQKITLDPK